jgi:hypothetical protein
MQPSIPTGPDNSSIADLRIQNQVLERLVIEQREHIEVLKHTAKTGRKDTWRRLLASMVGIALVSGLAWPVLADYYKGTDLLSEMERAPNSRDGLAIGYVTGAWDAFSLSFNGFSSTEAAEDVFLNRLLDCTKDWDNFQLYDLVKNKLQKEPQNRSDPGASLVWASLVEVCP